MSNPFEIEGKGLDAVATDGKVVACFVSTTGPAKMFKRRGIRVQGDDRTPIEMLVIEFHGVRTYVREMPDGKIAVVVGTEDLWP